MQSILLMCNRLDIYHQKSGRKVLTMSGGKTYHAEVPSFTVKISSEQELDYVSEQWFHFAQENNMWLLTQCSSLQYKDGFATIDIGNEPTILLVDHDAQGILFITGSVYYQNKDRILSLFQ
ncbi:hypothetical protein F9279_09320 [Bacillus sp. B1-b2]|nr:hypothetical protein F9279_09320 [Bacillus sp. B1-b2]